LKENLRASGLTVDEQDSGLGPNLSHWNTSGKPIVLIDPRIPISGAPP
jgi:hypothetical protein